MAFPDNGPHASQRGCDLKHTRVSPSLIQGVKALIAQALAICETDPGMCDAAAMVYVGDVYVLREEIRAINNSTRCERCPARELGDDAV